jgi:hypothetical protein
VTLSPAPSPGVAGNLLDMLRSAPGCYRSSGPVSSLLVEDMIPAGDVDVGDVIVLPGADEAFLVRMVHLGRGRLIFTLTSASGDSPEEERAVKMTAEVRVRKRGRDMVQ